MKPIILLIEDDYKTENSIRDVLDKDYQLEVAISGEEAAKILEKKQPDLLIIDYDLKKKDGLQIYRELSPNQKTIMLSALGSIPLSVTATKFGVAEFLHKPIQPETLKKAVAEYIAKEEEKFILPDGVEWLRGESPNLREMFFQIKKALLDRNIILLGEEGIDKIKIAEIIHLNSFKKERRFIHLDMASFNKEGMEVHFWAVIKETLASGEEDRTGTIYLGNFGNLDENFKYTILNFLHERKGNFDRSIRAIIGIKNRLEFQGFDLKAYTWLEIPPLSKRKEDIPLLLNIYLKIYANQYNKKVKNISAELLEFLVEYDYPGNYQELKDLIQAATLKCNSESLSFCDVPVSLINLISIIMKKERDLSFEEALQSFEKNLYQVLLQKSKGHFGEIARFLDIPEIVLTKRFEELKSRAIY